MTMEEIAALDMGSKNFKLVRGHCSDGRIGTRMVQKVRLNLGTTITANQGVIPWQKLAEIDTVLTELQDYCHQHGITRLMAIATHAVNHAKNGAEVLALCRNRGIDLEIVDGPREAEIGYLAATHGESEHLVSELGSHSCQIAWLTGGRIESSCFQPGYMGAYTDFIRPATTLQQARTDYRAFLENAITELPTNTRRYVALASNTVTGFVLGKDKDQATGLLPRSALLGKLHQLDALTPQQFETLKRNNLKADKLLAGSIFLDYLLERSGHGEALITDVELPVGLIVEYFQGRQASI